LTFIVTKTTSYVQSCLLKYFIVHLLSYCLKILKKKLLGYSIHVSNGSHPLVGRQYTLLLETSIPILSIPCYTTQVNAIKVVIIPSGNIVMCWGALIDTWCGKPNMMWETVCDHWWQLCWEAMATIKKDQIIKKQCINVGI